MTKRTAGQLLVYLLVPAVIFDIAVLGGMGLGLLPTHRVQWHLGTLICSIAIVLVGRKLAHRKPYQPMKKD